MACCPALKDSEACETSLLGMIPGCSKCLFTYEVGEWAGVGCQSFCRMVHVAGRDWQSLRHSQGKALQKELVSRLRRDLHFCFDQKRGGGG